MTLRPRVLAVLAASAALLATTALAPSATASTDDQASTVTAKIAAADKKAEPDAPASGKAPSGTAKKRVPYASFYAPYECNPHKYRSSNSVYDRYCWNGGPNGDFASYSTWAIDWAQRHTSKRERNPVPFPSLGDGGGGRLAMLPHTTYVVYYTTAKKDFVGPVYADKVWKYGITSIPHYQTRANVGRSACNKWAKKKGYKQECRRTWVSVNTATYGWDFGRFMEASLIKEYERANGDCPPGNPKCR